MLLDQEVTATRDGSGKTRREACVAERAGRGGVLHRPTCQVHRVASAVMKLDEVVLIERPAETPAPIYLADYNGARSWVAADRDRVGLAALAPIHVGRCHGEAEAADRVWCAGQDAAAGER